MYFMCFNGLCSNKKPHNFFINCFQHRCSTSIAVCNLLVLLDHTTERTEFSFSREGLGEDSSPFGFCETGDKICCSDHEIHCIYDLDIASRDVSIITGGTDVAGSGDGPVALFCFTTNLASRGEIILWICKVQ